jgi:L-aspartate oxidase
MAQRAGARVINTEFIQFHPTTFHQEGAPHFLISEAVRGAGARLVHGDGRPFMDKYDPEWRDLAPRDVVARSIHHELIGRDVPNVFLDLRSYIPQAEIRRRFPRHCRPVRRVWGGYCHRFSARRAGGALFVRRGVGG